MVRFFLRVVVVGTREDRLDRREEKMEREVE